MMFLKENFSKGAAVVCLNAHFPILEISENDITQEDANEIGYLLKQYQYHCLSEKQMEQQMKDLIK